MAMSKVLSSGEGGLSIPPVKQESGEAERMLEWSWNESQTKGRIAVAVCKKWKENRYTFTE